MNYYLKPIQNQKLLDVREQCQTLSDTYAVLQRRGLCLGFLNTMYECDLIHWACVRVNYLDEHPTRIPSWLIQLDPSHGGFGCVRPGMLVTSKQKFMSPPNLKLQALNGPHLLQTNMTNDWISFVSEKLPESSRHINVIALRNAMFEVNYYKVLRATKNGADMVKYKNDWKKWIESHRHLGISEHSINQDYFTVSKITSILDNNPIVENLLEGRYHLVDVTYPLEVLQANISEELNAPTHAMGNITAMLRRLYANSAFKDIHSTASALNVSKHLALMWIIEHCISERVAGSDEVSIILEILQKHQIDLFDWMLKQSFGVLSCFKGVTHPGLILEIVTMVKELWIATWLEEKKPDDVNYFTQRFNNYCYRLMRKAADGTLEITPILF